MLSQNTHLIKRDGTTHEVISEAKSYLHASQLMESILTFWECSWGFIGRDAELVIQVWDKIEDRDNGVAPLYEFIMEEL